MSFPAEHGEEAVPLLFGDFQPPKQKTYHDGTGAVTVKTYEEDFLPERREKLSPLTDIGLDGFAVPDVREESRNGSRSLDGDGKVEPRRYAADIAPYLDKHPVIYHVVAHDTREEFDDWLSTVFSQGFSTIVLVGGESSDKEYPGPAIPEANEIARSHQDAPRDVTVGNVTIPWRQPTTEKSYRPFEWDRIREKDPDFVVSQLLTGAAYNETFDTERTVTRERSDLTETKRVLTYLDKCYTEAQEEPPLYLTSFTPLTGTEDTTFLEYLDVAVPAHLQETVAEEEESVAAQRTTQHALDLFEELLQYVEAEELSVPLGVQVERLRDKNTGYALDMVEAFDAYRGERK